MPSIHCCLLLKVWLSLQETIEDIDKDKDGLIDIEEYVGKCFFCFVFTVNAEIKMVRWIEPQLTVPWGCTRGVIDMEL